MARYYLIAASFLALALGWDSLPVKPGRLLAVLIHEMWHGLTAMMGGVQLETVRIHPDESGETLVTGHLRMVAFLLSVSAGYVGTAWTGAVLLRSGMKSAWERTTLAIFILLLFYMTYLFTEAGSTAYLTGLLTSLGLLILLVLGRDASGKGLVVLGSFLIFYSLFDLFDFRKEASTTDATILSRYLAARGWRHAESLITPVSLIWSALILAGVGLSLRSALRHASVTPEPASPALPDAPGVAAALDQQPGPDVGTTSDPPLAGSPFPVPGLAGSGTPQGTGAATMPPTPGAETSAAAPSGLPVAPAIPPGEIPPGWSEAEIAQMRALTQNFRAG